MHSTGQLASKFAPVHGVSRFGFYILPLAFARARCDTGCARRQRVSVGNHRHGLPISPDLRSPFRPQLPPPAKLKTRLTVRTHAARLHLDAHPGLPGLASEIPDRRPCLASALTPLRDPWTAAVTGSDSLWHVPCLPPNAKLDVKFALRQVCPEKQTLREVKVEACEIDRR